MNFTALLNFPLLSSWEFLPLWFWWS